MKKHFILSKITLVVLSGIMLSACGGGDDNEQPKKDKPDTTLREPEKKPTPPTETIPETPKEIVLNKPEVPVAKGVDLIYYQSLLDALPVKGKSTIQYSGEYTQRIAKEKGVSKQSALNNKTASLQAGKIITFNQQINIDDVLSQLDKNVSEKPTLYAFINKQHGELTAQETKSHHPVFPQKNALRQSDRISQFNDNKINVMINTGAADTSHKWTEEKIKEAFDWNRLERDRVVPLNIVDERGIVANPHELNFVLKDDEAKLIVIDNALFRTLELQYDRVKKEAYYHTDKSRSNYDDFTIDKMDEKYAHGDSVLYPILGQPYDSYRSDRAVENEFDMDWHSKKGQYFYGGLLHNKGNVRFLGMVENSGHPSINGSAATGSDELDKWLQDGYMIISASWNDSEPLSKFKDKPKEMTYAEYINQHQEEFGHYYGGWYAYNEAIKKGALFIQSLGNESDKEIPIDSRTPLMTEYPEAKEGYIAVGGYDQTTGKKGDYSNTCMEVKDYCIFAVGQQVPIYNAKGEKLAHEKIYSGYGYGTSLAAPYVAATAAGVKAIFPFMTNYQIQQTLFTTAKDIGEKGIDNVYGHGLIQPQFAFNGPARFTNKDFVVDFNNNEESLEQKHQLFRFSNDIDGDKGLIVKGNQHRSILSLSGFNTYQGKTSIDENAILNVDGVLQSPIENKGRLYGSGLLGHVNNYGNVHAYSIFRNHSPSDLRSQYAMQIQGDYTQDKHATLHTILGMPLLISGQAHLAGALIVEGIKSVFINQHGQLFEDALVSKGGVIGGFDIFAVPNYLENAELRYQTLNRENGEQLHTVSVFAKHKGLEAVATTQSSNVTGAKNLGRLEKAINNAIERESRTKQNYEEALKLATQKIADKSALTKLAGKAQTSMDTLAQFTDQLSGQELEQEVQDTSRFSALSQFYSLNQGLTQKLGLSLNTAYQKGNKKDYRNNLTIGYRNHRAGFNMSAYQGKMNNDTAYGVNSSFFYTPAFDVNARINIGLNNFKHFYRDAIGLSLDKAFRYNEVTVTPFLGYEFARHTVKDRKIGFNGFDLLLKEQHLKQHFAFSGVNLQWNTFVDLHLSYMLKHKLGANDMVINGALTDNVITSDYQSPIKSKTLHIAEVGISKQFGKWNAGFTTSLVRDNKTQVQYQLNLGYAF